MLFIAGIWLLTMGYALFYTGVDNFVTDNPVSLPQALGLQHALLPGPAPASSGSGGADPVTSSTLDPVAGSWRLPVRQSGRA